MKSYAVTFTFGGCVVVEAKNAADAESIVEDMDTGELLMLAKRI